MLWSEEKSRLLDDLSKANQRVEEITFERDEARAALAETRQELSRKSHELNAEIDAKTQSAHQTQEQQLAFSQLEAQRQSSLRELAALNEKYKETFEQNRQTELQNVSIKADLAKCLSSQELLAAEKGALLETISRLKSEIANHIQQQQLHQEQARASISQLEARNSQMMQVVAQLESKAAADASETSALRQQVAQSNSSLEEARAQINKIAQENAELVVHISNLEAKLLSVNISLSQATEASASLSERLKGCRCDLQRLQPIEKDRSLLEESHETLRNRIEEVLSENERIHEEAQQKAAQSEQTISHITARYHKLNGRFLINFKYKISLFNFNL